MLPELTRICHFNDLERLKWMVVFRSWGASSTQQWEPLTCLRNIINWIPNPDRRRLKPIETETIEVVDFSSSKIFLSLTNAISVQASFSCLIIIQLRYSAWNNYSHSDPADLMKHSNLFLCCKWHKVTSKRKRLVFFVRMTLVRDIRMDSRERSKITMLHKHYETRNMF